MGFIDGTHNSQVRGPNHAPPFERMRSVIICYDEDILGTTILQLRPMDTLCTFTYSN